MKQTGKRILAVLLTAVMLVACVPPVAFASLMDNDPAYNREILNALTDMVGSENEAQTYYSLMEQYGLNKVTIPERPSVFCDAQRCQEILAELKESQAELLVLLGDIPIAQFLNAVADVPYHSLQEYVDLYGYGTATNAVIDGRTIKILPLAHPRQIGALGAHSEKWNKLHQEWESKLNK